MLTTLGTTPRSPGLFVRLFAENIGIEQLQKENEALKERNLFLLAEVENARRRFDRLAKEMESTAISTMAKKLLPVADDLERVEKGGKKQKTQSVLNAVKIIESNLMNILKQFKIEKINSSDAEFDPAVHEAVALVPTPKGKKENMVYDTILHGYKLDNRLLRPAKVVVTKDNK